MQFISDLTFLQKLNLKPNHEFGVSAVNVCEAIWELIKGAGSYSPDMLKSNYTKPCFLPSLLFIPHA